MKPNVCWTRKKRIIIILCYVLGRSYLNYAEIKLRQGDKETAIDYINRTRVTHGGLPELQKSLSLEDTWKEYKRERRIELVSEGDRYWSVLRWGKADGLEVVPDW